MEVKMKKINKYLLDYDKTYPYFIDYIDSGKSFSNKILKEIDFKKGTFFTLLEDETFSEDLYKFEEALPASIDVESEESSTELAWDIHEFVGEFLAKNSKNMAVMDQYIVERTNLWKEGVEKGVDVAFYNQEVHYIIHPDAPPKSILLAIRIADAMWHLLVVLTSGLELPKTILNDNDFDIICKNLKYIITTCYDGEGYLFWERNS